MTIIKSEKDYTKYSACFPSVVDYILFDLEQPKIYTAYDFNIDGFTNQFYAFKDITLPKSTRIKYYDYNSKYIFYELSSTIKKGYIVTVEK